MAGRDLLAGKGRDLLAEKNKPFFDINVPEGAKADVPDSYAEYMAGSPAGRSIKGLASPLEGVTQLAAKTIIDPITGVAGLGHPAGDFMDKQIGESREAYDTAKQKQGVEGFDALEFGSSMALPMAAMQNTAKSLPMIEKILQGGAAGSAVSLAMPTSGENYEEDKLKSALIAGGFGGAFPPITAGAGKVGNYFDQLTRPWPIRNKAEKVLKSGEKIGKGIYKDIKEYIDDISEQSDIPRNKVIDALLDAKSKVPGNTPTSGQALTDAITKNKGTRFASPLIRLEDDISRSPFAGDILKGKADKARYNREQPFIERANTVMDDFDIPEDQLPAMLRQQADDVIVAGKPSYQKAPSVESIQDHATKPTTALEDALLTRKTNASQNYGRVAEDVIKSKKIDSLLLRPAAQKAIQRAKDGTLNKGGKWPEDGRYTAENLGRIKREIADMVSDKTSGLGPTQKAEMTSLVDELSSTLKRKSPGFKVAEDQFVSDSIPVNQIKLSNAILNKMRTPTGQEGRGQLLRSMQDEAKLLKQGTGFKASGVDEVFDPQMTQHTKNVASEMERDAATKSIARETSPVLSSLKGEVEPLFPRILNTKAAVSNWILQKIGKNATPEYERGLALIMKDPKNLAEIIKLQQTKGMTEGTLMNKVNNMVSAATGVASGGDK